MDDFNQEESSIGFVVNCTNQLNANPYFHRIEKNPQIETAARFVNNTNAHIFLTGKAGTGKTTFLRDLATKTHKSFVIVAPTGIAALNAKGVTIHSQFLLPLGTFVPVNQPAGEISDSTNMFTQNTLVRKHPLNKVRKQVLRDLDLLIIDEVSMLRSDVLDAIDFRLKHARRNYNQPFGGVQLLLIGDLFQLPPVVRDNEWNIMRQHYQSAWFFDALALRQSGYVYIELEKIYRQADSTFIRLLNNLRNNIATAEDIDELNKHYISESERDNLGEIITLTTHNYRADSINKDALAALNTKSKTFPASLEGDFPESMYPVGSDIELKENAQVMFIKNDSAEGAYFNGKLATVTTIDSDGIVVRMADSTDTYRLKKERWENRKYTIDATTKELEEEIVGSFNQYPIKLAWAITVHKSQGLTFEKAIVDVGKAFAPGQVYVALSRLRSLDGLYLGTRIDPNSISSDANVTRFGQQAETQPPLTEILEKAQKSYLEQVALKTFELNGILSMVVALDNGDKSDMEFEDETMRAFIPGFRNQLESQIKTTETFRSQLLRLIRDADKKQLLDRIGKGSTYFQEMIWTSLEALIHHTEEVRQLSRTKTYLNQLDEVDQLVMKKLEELEFVQSISKQIFENKDVQKSKLDSTALTKKRRDILEKVDKAIAEKFKGVKRKSGKRKKSGEPKKPKGETYEVSLGYFKEGMNIDEVAEKRGMSVSTIESHAARLIGESKLGIDLFMDKESAQEIAKALALDEIKTVTDAVKHFKRKYTYGQLRMVQAVVRG